MQLLRSWMTEVQLRTDWLIESCWLVNRKTMRLTDWLSERLAVEVTDWLTSWLNDGWSDWLQDEWLTDNIMGKQFNPPTHKIDVNIFFNGVS